MRAEDVDWFQLELAAHHVRRGGVVAHATEGVWGLACDAFNHRAVQKVLALKERPLAKGLIVIADSLEGFGSLLDALDARQRRTLAETWPGAVTFVIPAPHAPVWLRGEHAQLALRVPAHAQARRLCARVGTPLVSTSANPRGRAPARNALQVRRYFGRRLDQVLPGVTGGLSGPSEIRDLKSGKVLRRAADAPRG